MTKSARAHAGALEVGVDVVENNDPETLRRAIGEMGTKLRALRKLCRDGPVSPDDILKILDSREATP